MDKNNKDIKTTTATDFEQWLDAMKMVARLPGGVPSEFRRKLWLALSEKYLISKNICWDKEEKKCFTEVCGEDDEELGNQIVKDLHRTGSSLCSGPSGTINQAKLKKILIGYARWNPEVGYCQGFNMLGALILQVMDKNEIQSIKVMIYLVEGILPKGYFCDSLYGLQADMAVFRELMQIKLPKLAKHLNKLQKSLKETASFEPPLTNVFTMQWFLTLFCTCLPINCVLRVWDLILTDGSDILLRTALAIWSILEEKVIAIRTADDFYCKMGSLSRELVNGHLIDSNALIEQVIQYGPISDLQKMREKHLNDIEQWENSKSLKLYYSNNQTESDDESNNLSVAQTTKAWKLGKYRQTSGTFPPSNIPGHRHHNLSTYNKDQRSVALDISILKKQYEKLRERQRQAHIILTTAVTKQQQSSSGGGPAAASSRHVDQLLVGRSAITTNKGRKIGPPIGAIPPVRKSPPVTMSRQFNKKYDEDKYNNKKESAKIRYDKQNKSSSSRTSPLPSEILNERHQKSGRESESSTYSENSDDSSTSTSLCDEIVDGNQDLYNFKSSTGNTSNNDDDDDEIEYRHSPMNFDFSSLDKNLDTIITSTTEETAEKNKDVLDMDEKSKKNDTEIIAMIDADNDGDDDQYEKFDDYLNFNDDEIFDTSKKDNFSSSSCSSSFIVNNPITSSSVLLGTSSISATPTLLATELTTMSSSFITDSNTYENATSLSTFDYHHTSEIKETEGTTTDEEGYVIISNNPSNDAIIPTTFNNIMNDSTSIMTATCVSSSASNNNIKITSTSQLSPLPDISNYLNITSNISPLKSPLLPSFHYNSGTNYNYSELMSSESSSSPPPTLENYLYMNSNKDENNIIDKDEKMKNDKNFIDIIEQQGVTNEYFERINNVVSIIGDDNKTTSSSSKRLDLLNYSNSNLDMKMDYYDYLNITAKVTGIDTKSTILTNDNHPLVIKETDDDLMLNNLLNSNKNLNNDEIKNDNENSFINNEKSKEIIHHEQKKEEEKFNLESSSITFSSKQILENSNEIKSKLNENIINNDDNNYDGNLINDKENESPSDKVLKIIEENSLILHKILKKNISDINNTDSNNININLNEKQMKNEIPKNHTNDNNEKLLINNIENVHLKLKSTIINNDNTDTTTTAKISTPIDNHEINALISIDTTTTTTTTNTTTIAAVGTNNSILTLVNTNENDDKLNSISSSYMSTASSSSLGSSVTAVSATTTTTGGSQPQLNYYSHDLNHRSSKLFDLQNNDDTTSSSPVLLLKGNNNTNTITTTSSNNEHQSHNNINDQLESIKNTIKSIDSLCDEKFPSYNKIHNKYEKYIEKLFENQDKQQKSNVKIIENENIENPINTTIDSVDNLISTTTATTTTVANTEITLSPTTAATAAINTIMTDNDNSDYYYYYQVNKTSNNDFLYLNSNNSSRYSRNFKREKSPRRRKDEEREEYESRTGRNIENSSSSSLLLVDDYYNNTSIKNETNTIDTNYENNKFSNNDKNIMISTTTTPNNSSMAKDKDLLFLKINKENSKSLTNLYTNNKDKEKDNNNKYLKLDKPEIRHTTFTSTFYDRYLLSQKLDKLESKNATSIKNNGSGIISGIETKTDLITKNNYLLSTHHSLKNCKNNSYIKSCDNIVSKLKSTGGITTATTTTSTTISSTALIPTTMTTGNTKIPAITRGYDDFNLLLSSTSSSSLMATSPLTSPSVATTALTAASSSSSSALIQHKPIKTFEFDTQLDTIENLNKNLLKS